MCACVCLFAISSKIDNPNEIKFWWMILHGSQTVHWLMTQVLRIVVWIWSIKLPKITKKKILVQWLTYLYNIKSAFDINAKLWIQHHRQVFISIKFVGIHSATSHFLEHVKGSKAVESDLKNKTKFIYQNIQKNAYSIR